MKMNGKRSDSCMGLFVVTQRYIAHKGGHPVRAVGLVLLVAATFAGCHQGPKDPWQDARRNLCRLEKDLRGNGLVTVKRPDVWTENRLYPYRREFEEVFYNTQMLKDFKPKLTASESAVQTRRLGMALSAALEAERIRADKGPGLGQFLSMALLENLTPGQGMTDTDFFKILQAGAKAYVASQTGLDPTAFAGLLAAVDGASGGGDSNTDGNSGGGSGENSGSNSGTGEGGNTGDAPATDAAGGQTPSAGAAPTTGSNESDSAESGTKADLPSFDWALTKANIPDLYDVPGASATLDLLSPYEVQKQKRAFVQQNHLFRIGNEPDDGTRMNGYRLYYMRFMVSVTPSAKTRSGYSAEVMLTPTYPVAEAARDWVAQYIRGMLREKILRVVELGLERVIAERLQEYANTTLTWRKLQEASRLVQMIEGSLDRAHQHINENRCESAKNEIELANNAVEKLELFVQCGASKHELAQLGKRFSDYLATCEPKKFAVDAKKKSDDQADRKLIDAEKKLREIKSDFATTFPRPLRVASIDDASWFASQYADSLRASTEPLQRAYDDSADINSILKENATFQAAVATILDRPVPVTTLADDQRNWLNSRLDRAKEVIEQLEKLEKDLETTKADQSKKNDEVRQTEQAAIEKWLELRAVKDDLKVVLGAQQDSDAVAYAHDVGTKLRNEYLGIMRLAQLAYDELAREADAHLRVPNAVDLSDDSKKSQRRDRARDALCQIVSGRSVPPASQNSGTDVCQGANKPTAGLSNLVNFDLNGLLHIDKLADEALKELADRIGRYSSPVDTYRYLYSGDAPSDKSKSADIAGSGQGTVAINALSNLIGIRSDSAKSNKVTDDSAVKPLDYAKLRGFFSTDNWPIYTFAVAPFSEAENIGRAIDLNNEVQIMLNGALSAGGTGDVKGALEYARAAREQLRAVEVNRTVVGLVRGEQNFGWQFNPPYTLPVAVKAGSRYARTGAYRNMPSQTHEVFALVAVPGFLRSMEFGVHYDWTAIQRTDGEVIGTNKAAEYLLSFQDIDTKLENKCKFGTEGQKAPFLSELYRQRMELVESSLPLRMMRRVFLPYADVSERMTNTAGVSNLLPQITRVIPRYLPSDQSVVVTVEGKNFDTGRIGVIVGGYSAGNVQVLNERTIVATVPARGIISDLAVIRRDGLLYEKARATETGKKLLHDIEGIVDVIVITPAGLATDVALLRITRPAGADSASGGGITGSVPDKSVVVASPLWDQAGLVVTLSEGIKETSGTLVLKYDTTKIDLPVDIKDRTVTLRDAIGTGTSLSVLADKEISNLSLYPQGGHAGGLSIKGKLKVEKLTAKAPEKLTVQGTGTDAIVAETKFILDFARPVKVKSGKLVIGNKDDSTQSQSIEFADVSGSSIEVSLAEGVRKEIAKWLGSRTEVDLVVRLENLKRATDGASESLDCGRTRLVK